MLEQYFVKSSTIDRIRANWLAPQIEPYVEWMQAQGYADRHVFLRVPLLSSNHNSSLIKVLETASQPKGIPIWWKGVAYDIRFELQDDDAIVDAVSRQDLTAAMDNNAR